MLKRIMTLLVSLAVSGCQQYIAPDSWTIRDDCRIRASQRNQDYDIREFIDKIKAEEHKDFGFVLTPAGAASITNEIKQCHIDLESCRSSH